jgi:DNA-binding winged helix-turn-helix (wHTH) protein
VVDVYIGYLRKKLSGRDFGFEIRTLRNRGFCLTGTFPQLVQHEERAAPTKV